VRGKEDKIRVYKMRQKARYRRTQGHRQTIFEILIKDIK
jgi:ribosomal protein L21